MPRPEGEARAPEKPGLLGLAALVYAVALGFRLPIMLTRPVDGDEAIQGAAAQRVLEGDWTWYFPGQKYGGTLETIPQALFQSFDEGSTFLLRLPLVLIACGTVVLFAFLAWELSRSRAAFAAAGLLAAVFPPLYVFLGSWQTAGYNSATFLGVLAVYLLARAVRPGVTDGRRGLAVAAAGLAVGIALYQQPIAAFVVAAVGTTTLVATWPRGLALLRPRYVLAFAALALVGASPEIVAVAGGLGTDTANNPLPPGYQLTPGLLAAVAGFDLFGTSPEGIFPAGIESMGWNVIGLQYLDLLQVPKWLAIAGAAVAWAWAVATLASAARTRLGKRAASADWQSDELLPVRMRTAVAAGVAVTGIVIALSILKLPPFAKYAYGVSGFVAFGLALVLTQSRIRSRAAIAAASLAVAALVGISLIRTFETFDHERESDLRSQRSWLADRIEELPDDGGGPTQVWGDYWIVYPLEFLTGGELEGVAAAFNRFEDREPSGEMPDGRVIVPLVPELPFRDQIHAMLREFCSVESREEAGGAELLIARCPARDDPVRG